MQKFIGTILMIAIGLSFNPNPVKKDANSKESNSLAARETVEVIQLAKGEVRQIGDQDIYMIWCGEKYLKLNPFNLPKEFKKSGLQVNFSGNIKYSNPLEDQWGELLEITSVSVASR